MNTIPLDDQIFIPIYNDFLSTFYDCEKIGSSKINLMGIIFHEIMFNTSVHIYNREWYGKIYDYEYPFLGFRHSRNNSPAIIHEKSYKKKLLSLASHLSSKSDFNVGILNPSGLNQKKLLLDLFKSRIKFSFIHHTYISIPNFNDQLKIIKKNIKEIWKKYQIEVNPEYFFRAIISSYEKFTVDQEKLNNYDCLVIGTPVRIPVRVEAASAMSRKIPTICIDHGNETGTADHPSWGYDEQSYCSHFVGYGPQGKKSLREGVYTKSLFNNQPEYLESNSNFIQRKFDKNQIKKLNFNDENLKGLYVPNRLEGYYKLGPFHSISDEEYIKWQKYLINSLPGIHLKEHPKQILKSQIENCTIVKGYLESCINDYDFFVTDTALSTAFANIAATNKTIIYFNIGLGNISKVARKFIYKRVIWIDVNIDNPGNLRKKILDCGDQRKINLYTPSFSLSNTEKNREDVVVNLIQQLKASR
tara:strand:+ start:141 stop:1559 length:1419 start_codon:yes stop_codon:yes gene_type:complete